MLLDDVCFLDVHLDSTLSQLDFEISYSLYTFFSFSLCSFSSSCKPQIAKSDPEACYRCGFVIVFRTEYVIMTICFI